MNHNKNSKKLATGRVMMGLALATVLTGAIAQSGSAAKPAPVEANPLAPAVVAVQAAQDASKATAGPTDAQATIAPVAAAPAPGVDPVAALQQSVNSQQAGGATGQIVRTDANVSPYVVPQAGQGIFEGSAQVFREISYLKAEEDLISARTSREAALKKQAEAHAELLDVVSGRSKAKENAPAGTVSAPSPEQNQAVAAAVLAQKLAEAPYVNGVYIYGDKAYAEIVLGSTWVMATTGTQLLNGDRVASITPAGVTLVGKKGRRVLPVRGSASVN